MSSNLVSISQAAKQLEISVEDAKKLIRQGILHPQKQKGKDSFFLENDIAQIKLNGNPMLSEEAAQVGIQIEREVVFSVSKLQNLGKRIFVLSLIVFSFLFLSIIIIAFLFKISPQKTSDFFGYYYRFNIIDQLQASVLGTSTESDRILQATLKPVEAPIKTSLLADVFKPIAATSLVMVKAVDGQIYEQIVKNPILSAGIQGPTGTQGIAGVQGPIGIRGPSGVQGLVGVQGPVGVQGLAGLDGINGLDGTSVADVMTVAGDLIIRDVGNVTARLAVGLDGQVLTITSGIPSWVDFTGGSVLFSNLTGGTNIAAAMLVGTDASLDFTGSGTINASSLSGATLGTTTATSGNLLIGSGTQWVTQAISGEATIDGTGALTINYAAAQSADATHKGFLNALDWNTFYDKQDALGFTPENAINKSTNPSLGTSDTLYSSQNAIKTYIDNNALGLNWKTSLQAVNVIANAATPITIPIESDAYIIDTGGNTGAWASFAPGDIVQFQTGVWVKLKSLALGDKFGIALRSSTTPSGTFAGFNNYVFEITGGTSGAFTYTGIAPSNGDSRYISNTNSYYHGISFTYSVSLDEWVQLSSTVNLSYGSGLKNVSNVISLGDLTADWNQAGFFAINTIGNIAINGGTLSTNSTTANLFNTEATTLNIGGAATTIGLGAAGATVTGGGGLTINSGATTAITLDSGTTGGVNIGTGANAKNISLGNITGTTAVNINSGTGNINFTAGPSSSSEKIQMGNSGTATPDLLVLDNGTADPVGTNGASYYNTSTNKFRCYENSAWRDCDTSGLDNIKTSQSDTLASLSTTETSYLSVTITPTSTSKNIWITADAIVINNTNNVMITFRIRRGNDCTGTQVGSDVKAGSVKNAILPGTTGVMNFIDSPNTTSATTYQLCALATNTVGITSDGVGGRQITAAEVKLGADLAEGYNSLDTTLVPGEVVAVDETIEGGAKRSEQAYQKDLLGVVSTNPGMVLSGSAGPGKPILVALSGRVPVKVNTEGGVIKAGDYLTSSSVPGVAMKATRAGAIIGTALTSFDGEEAGQILIFIKNGFSLGNNTEGINTLMQLLGEPSDKFNNLSITSQENINASNSAELASISAVEKNLIEYIIQTVSNLFKDSVEFLGKVIFHSDVSFLGRPTFNSDSGGFAQIKAGAFEVMVIFDEEYETTPIIMGSPDVAVIYAISDVNTKGFKIKLNQIETRDIKFAWTAIAIKNAKTSVSAPAPTSLSLPELILEIEATPLPESILVTEIAPLSDASSSAVAIQSSTPTSIESFILD